MTGAGRQDEAGDAAATTADEDQAALAGLEQAWAGYGYHSFSADDGTWSAISSAGEVLTGSTLDVLDSRIRAHMRERQ
jgi:hypothetical protein